MKTDAIWQNLWMQQKWFQEGGSQVYLKKQAESNKQSNFTPEGTRTKS